MKLSGSEFELKSSMYLYPQGNIPLADDRFVGQNYEFQLFSGYLT